MAKHHKPKPQHQSVEQRARHDRAFLKRALNDAGLRSKLPSSMLPTAMRQQREMNTRLAAPIVPGSSTTERDLANAAQAATTVRYQPQESQLDQQFGVAQQMQRDTGSFYDQYKADLAQHAAHVAAYQAGAQQALAQTAAGITGLSGQEGADLQQQANVAAAQQGVTPTQNMAPMLSDAAAIRQSLIGTFQAQQAMQGANANTYADTQAHVVAPGQKLAAQAQAAGRTRDVGKQIQGLKAEEGAFNQQFRDQRRQDEFKNVLAQETLGANVAQDQAQAATASQRITETTRHNRTQEQIGKDRIKAQQRTARERNRNAAKTAQQKADLAAGKVNQYGYTDAAWRAMSVAQRQQIIKDFAAKGKGNGKDQAGKGPNWQTNAQQGQGASDAVNLKDLANRAKGGQPFVPGHARQKPLDRHQAAAKIQQSAKVRDPILLTAALDAAYDHHLSRETVRRLIAAGYKPSKIAQALGVPTPANYTPPSTPNRSAGSAVPGIGPTVANR